MLLIAPKGRFLSKGKLFKKELLRAGTYQHPIDPWAEPLVLDNDDIVELANSSNAAMESGGMKPWVPLGHSYNPEDNRGWVKRFTAEASPESGKMAVYAYLEITDKKTAGKILNGSIDCVSVGLDSYGNHKGETFGLRIEHVALCSDPVFSGQDSFVALARSSSKNPNLKIRVLSWRRPMSVKHKARRFSTISTIGAAAMPKIRRRLSITSAVRKAAKILSIDLGPRVTQDRLDELCEALIAKVGTPGESGEAAAVKCLARTADATFADLHKERDDRFTLAVKDAIKAGKIPATVEADVKSLLSVRHGFSLSAKGEASAIDVRAAVEKIIAAIPDGAVLSTEERTKRLSLAGGQPPTETPAFDSKKEVADRLASLKSRGLSK